MKQSDIKVIRYAAVAQVVFGVAIIAHNLLLINSIGRVEGLQVAGLLDGAVVIILSCFYLLAIRKN